MNSRLQEIVPPWTNLQFHCASLGSLLPEIVCLWLPKFEMIASKMWFFYKSLNIFASFLLAHIFSWDWCMVLKAPFTYTWCYFLSKKFLFEGHLLAIAFCTALKLSFFVSKNGGHLNNYFNPYVCPYVVLSLVLFVHVCLCPKTSSSFCSRIS